MRIGRSTLTGHARKAAHLKAAWSIAILTILIAGVGCTRGFIEVANETSGPITVRVIIEGNPYSPFTDEVAPGEVLTLETGRGEHRWEITDENGVVLMELVVSYDLIDYYNGRIVVR